MRRDQPRLIVITGPIGAGKSTCSMALARVLRGRDVEVAVIDLDQVYGFVRHEGRGEQLAWRRARTGTAALARELFDVGMSAVILDGEFFNQTELDEVMGGIAPEIRGWFFSLKVSYERALQRAQGDATRGASRDPGFLEPWWHTTYEPALPFLETASVVIDTELLTLEEVVAKLVTATAAATRYLSD
jgi:thymidylate kinase